MNFLLTNGVALLGGCIAGTGWRIGDNVMLAIGSGLMLISLCLPVIMYKRAKKG